MRRKKLFLLLFIIFSISTIKAQSELYSEFDNQDTIFIYDTIFLVDTIQIIRTSKEVKDLEKLTPLEISYLDNSSSNKKESHFSNQQTATLLNLRIISLNNFNSKNKEMKKLGVLGLMFFAFQNMILAQHNVGVHVGSGVYNLTNMNSSVLGRKPHNTLFRPTLQLGISYRKLIMKEKLFFDVGVYFSKLKPSRIALAQEYLDNGTFSETGIFTVKETEYFPDDVSFVTRRNYNLVSIPLTISLNSKFFQPTIGAEVDYRHVSSILEPTSHGFEDVYMYSGPSHFKSIGFTALLGFRMPVTKRFNMSVIYAKQIIDIFSLENEYLATHLGGYMQRLDITLRYQLLKRKKS